MRSMTKSAVRLAREALAVGRAALPPYSGPRSRHDFTQPQLFALLVLRQALRTDYRGLVTLLAEWGELRRVLELRKVPHYSTLCYAAHRLLAGAEKGGPSAGSSRSASPAPPGWGFSPRRPPPRWTPPGSTPGTPAPTIAMATPRRTAPPTPGSMAAAPRPRRTAGRAIPS